MRCYYRAKAAAGKGYQKRLKEMWDSRNPAKSFRTVNNLCCQARNVIRSHLLTVIDLEELEQEALRLDATAVAVNELGAVTPTRG